MKKTKEDQGRMKEDGKNRVERCKSMEEEKKGNTNE